MKLLSIAAVILLLQTSSFLQAVENSRGILVPSTLHFGKVKKGEVVTKQIAVINSEAVAAEKLVIKSSCSCTTVISAPARLEPNQAGIVTLRYAPNTVGDAKIDMVVCAKINNHPMMSQIAGSATIVEPAGQGDAPPESPLHTIQAENAIKESRTVIVDIRSATEFNTVHIPGAFNLPLFALKAQDFLKNQPILLVNDGIVTNDIKHEIEQLAKAGFRSVKYLSGGVRAWRRAHGPLEGSATGDAALLGMERLGEVEQNHFWRYVFVTSDEEGSKLAQSLKKEDTSTEGLQTLVIAKDRDQYQKLEAKLAGMKRSVYYLNGNLSDWIQYHSTPAALASRSPIVIGSPQSAVASIHSGKGSPCKACH